MCGIVAYIGQKKKTLNVLINGLEHLEYRGYDSAGIAYLQNGKLIIKKEPGRISNLKKEINFDEQTNLGIGHTRWATHGEANYTNSHPHTSNKVTIVHNGIIENYLELKQELSKMNYQFLTETDTEVACHLLDYYYHETNNMLEAIKLFKIKVKGSYAIAAICLDEPDTIYAIKKNSPLIIGLGDNENYLASDIHAIIEYTNKYIALEDGYYAKINKDNIRLYDEYNTRINPKIKEYAFDKENVSKGNYDHYMLKEIYEEPSIIRKLQNIKNLPNINKYERITIVACGSAMHAGLIGKYLIENYLNIPTDVEIASEFRYKKLFIDKNNLVIAISQSGETADTLEAVKIAKKYACHTIGIVNVKESSIARTVDEVIYTEAGPEIAVATTKAYLAQILVLSQLTYINCKQENKTYLEDLKKIPIIIEELLENNEYQKIAQDIYQKKNMFYIGRGIDYAMCMEGSLKIKEISYLHSEAYPAGELKHGTISLIDDNTPVFGLITDERIADKTISNLKEVKARHAFVIYITTDKLEAVGDFYDRKIILPTVNTLLQPLINVIPLQLIAYYVAKLNNCDIDKPRNLAKSVTVE